jgi:hypothetical protein
VRFGCCRMRPRGYGYGFDYPLIEANAIPPRGSNCPSVQVTRHSKCNVAVVLFFAHFFSPGVVEYNGRDLPANAAWPLVVDIPVCLRAYVYYLYQHFLPPIRAVPPLRTCALALCPCLVYHLCACRAR